MMAGHWADIYVGLAAAGDNPCWSLVRRVWADRLGLVMPDYEPGADPAATIHRNASNFAPVAPGEERPLDAVIIHTNVKSGLAWVRAAAHIGVVVAPGLVLHQERDRLSVIEPISKLDVARVLRCPVLA